MRVQKKMTHLLKLNLRFCDDVFSGVKPFEIRYNDRDYHVGDIIKFLPVNDSGRVSSSHPIVSHDYVITYLLDGWGLQDGYVAFAITEKGWWC